MSDSIFDRLEIDEAANHYLRSVAHGALQGHMADGHDGSALHVAARKGNMEVCRRLIEFGADIWMRDRALEMPIHYIAASGHLAACKLLLEAAGPRREEMLASKAGSGYTPFQLAVLYGRVELIKFFVLECGEDPMQRTATNRRLQASRNPRHLDDIDEMLRSLASELSIADHVGFDAGMTSSSAAKRKLPSPP